MVRAFADERQRWGLQRCCESDMLSIIDDVGNRKSKNSTGQEDAGRNKEAVLDSVNGKREKFSFVTVLRCVCRIMSKEVHLDTDKHLSNVH